MPYKSPAQKSAYNKAYYKANTEAIRKQHADYNAAHPGANQQRCARYYAEHQTTLTQQARDRRRLHGETINKRRRETYPQRREKERQAKRAYMLAHPEKKHTQLVRLKQWNQAHPEATYARMGRYRARKASAAIHDFTATQWREMQAHYNHCCVYCGKRTKGKLTQDHITPLSKGGNHTKSNIVPACQSCNARKSAGPPLKPIQPLLL